MRAMGSAKVGEGKVSVSVKFEDLGIEGIERTRSRIVREWDNESRSVRGSGSRLGS